MKPSVVTTRVVGRLITAIAVGVAIPMLLGTVPARASTVGSANGSATAIVASAKSAMLHEDAVSETLTESGSLSGIGEIVIKESGFVTTTSGSQVLSTTGPKSYNGPPLPAGTVLNLNGTLYINGNVEYWESFANLTNSNAARVEGRWIQVPRSNSIYAGAIGDTTIPSVTQDLFHATSYTKGGTSTVDGAQVIQITYTNTGPDSGPYDVYLALSGSHLPVEAISKSGSQTMTLDFVHWGVTQKLATPAGAVLIQTLVT